MKKAVSVYSGPALERYHFGEQHPFGPKRLGAFMQELFERGLKERVSVQEPAMAGEEEVLSFHTPGYVERVKEASRTGVGYLDYGDTPAFEGVYEASLAVVGTTLKAVDELISGACRHAFVPIAGLHHARRDRAAGFCVFNDCGVAIETLRRRYGLRRVAYVDIDAHHGDGVFYGFEDDADLVFVDFHEDGRYLYPGTGFAEETGKGDAKGTKLNIPMPPKADDESFFRLWPRAEQFVRTADPDFILLQCGADGLAGDPITHLRYSPEVHARAARNLCRLANEMCGGRILAMGGGGYALSNLARAWCAVVEAFVESD